MRPAYHDIELPHVARQITFVRGLRTTPGSVADEGPKSVTDDERVTTPRAIGLFRPFSGLLGSRPSLGHWQFSLLSYLVHQPLAVTEYRERVGDVHHYHSTQDVHHHSMRVLPERHETRARAPETVATRLQRTTRVVTRVVGERMNRDPTTRERASRAGTTDEHVRRQTPLTVTNSLVRGGDVEWTSAEQPAVAGERRRWENPEQYHRVRTDTRGVELHRSVGDEQPVKHSLRQRQSDAATLPGETVVSQSTLVARLTRLTAELNGTETTERTRQTSGRPVQYEPGSEERLTTRRTVVRDSGGPTRRPRLESTGDVRQRRTIHPGQQSSATLNRVQRRFDDQPSAERSPLRDSSTSPQRAGRGGTEPSGPRSVAERPQSGGRAVEAVSSRSLPVVPTTVVTRVPRTVERTVERVERRRRQRRISVVTRRPRVTVVTGDPREERTSEQVAGTVHHPSSRRARSRPRGPSSRSEPADAAVGDAVRPAELTVRTEADQPLDAFDDAPRLVHRREPATQTQGHSATQPTVGANGLASQDGLRGGVTPSGQRRPTAEPYNSPEQHISPLESITNRHMAADPTLDRLVDHLFERFERKLRIERERRGR